MRAWKRRFYRDLVLVGRTASKHSWLRAACSLAISRAASSKSPAVSELRNSRTALSSQSRRALRSRLSCPATRRSAWPSSEAAIELAVAFKNGRFRDGLLAT